MKNLDSDFKHPLYCTLFLCLFLTSCQRNFDVPQSNWSTSMADPRVKIDMDSVELGLIIANTWDIGTGVNGYVWHARNARAAVILHHGYSEYAFRYVDQFNRLIPRLLSMGISVYALDARGHGYSPGKRGFVDVEQSVSDHLVARALLKRQPLPVFVIGHSLGGLVTTSSLVKTQEGLAGIITMSAGLYYEDNSLLNRFLTRPLAAFAPRATLFGSEDNDEDLYRGASDDPVFQNDTIIYRGQIPLKTLSTTLKLTKQNTDYYSRITIPALILHGTDDKVANPQGSQQLYNGISSPDKMLKLIQGGHHELLNDESKDEVTNLILTWLENRI